MDARAEPADDAENIERDFDRRSCCRPAMRHRPYSLRRRVRRRSLFPVPQKRGMERREAPGRLAQRPLAGVDGARRAPTAGTRLPGAAASGARAPIDGGGSASRRSTLRRALSAHRPLLRHRNVTRDDARCEQGGCSLADDRNKVKIVFWGDIRSFPRKRESSFWPKRWVPAFAGTNGGKPPTHPPSAPR